MPLLPTPPPRYAALAAPVQTHPQIGAENMAVPLRFRRFGIRHAAQRFRRGR